MKTLERQTDLTLKELLDFLSQGNCSWPTCLLVNEVGAICQRGEDPDKTGENYLLSALNDERLQIRAIAYCCLSCIESCLTEHFAVLAAFRKNPENEPLLDSINKSLQ